MKNSERMEPLVEPAIDTLRKVFRGDVDLLSDKDISVARIAASSLSTYAKLVQTENAQQGLAYNIARDLAQNPEQLAAYIKATMPDTGFIEVMKAKELPEKTKEDQA